MSQSLNLIPRKGPANGHPRRVAAYDLVIRASTRDVNLAATLGSRAGARNIRVLVLGNVLIGASSTGVAAFDCGTLPAGASVELTVRGRIQGMGGGGGNGSRVDIANNPTAGAPGGDAITARCPMTIKNYGVIAGGGGGGGGGGRGATTNGSAGAGGGGGAGDASAARGDPGTGAATCRGTSGGYGTLDAGGAGGTGCNWNGSDPSGAGGAGGGPGQVGSNGQAGNGGAGAAGGAAGAAVAKNGNAVTVIGGGIIMGMVT